MSPAGQDRADAQAHRSAVTSEVVTLHRILAGQSMKRLSLSTVLVTVMLLQLLIIKTSAVGAVTPIAANRLLMQVKLSFTNVAILRLKFKTSRHRALIDDDSNMSCVNADLITDRSLSVVKQLHL
jgi:hypothetical protein